MHSTISRLLVLLIILVSMGCEDEKINEKLQRDRAKTIKDDWSDLINKNNNYSFTF